jgi:adenylosuccinate synthase
VAEKFSKYVTDVTNMVYDFTGNHKSLLFESAQGTFLDLDHGTYPYVTSSNPIAGNISNGVGISPREIDEVIGVAKAYTTRVGNGPFPTELTGEVGEELRNAGNEYGATTGRPRRCGWLDLVMLKRASNINGLTSLAITKMDILTSLTQFKVCTNYRYNGDSIQGYPADLDILENCDPVYKEFQGWKEDISNANSYDELPSLAKDYLHEISEECNTPISIISIGKERKETIFT